MHAPFRRDVMCPSDVMQRGLRGDVTRRFGMRSHVTLRDALRTCAQRCSDTVRKYREYSCMSIALPQDSVHEFNPYTQQGSGFTFETHNEGDYMLTSPAHAARTARHGTAHKQTQVRVQPCDVRVQPRRQVTLRDAPQERPRRRAGLGHRLQGLPACTPPLAVAAVVDGGTRG